MPVIFFTFVGEIVVRAAITYGTVYGVAYLWNRLRHGDKE